MTGSEEHDLNVAAGRSVEDARRPAADGGGVVGRHGHTVADLERMTREAAWGSRWRILTVEERADIARFAIAEYLLTCEQRPEFWDAVNVGQKAIGASVESDGRYRGVYVARNGVAPGTAMPRFWKFWTSAATPTQSPEAILVEPLALRQIWPKLTRPHRAVLLALATYEDYEQAAQSMGRPYKSFVSTVYTARKQFFRLWLEHETPMGAWGNDRRKRIRPRHHKTITNVTIGRRERKRQRKQAALAAAEAS